MRLLVAESDPALGIFLQRGFDAEHYVVDLTSDSEETKSLAQERNYDTAILDLDLPHENGLDVLRSLREGRQQLPILILTNRTRPEERAHVLDLGADDLMLKPFAFSELSARVRALLRRGGAAGALLRVEDLQMNRVEHSVQRAGKKIALTPREFALLEYLMRRAGTILTRTMIADRVWNGSFDGGSNIVDVYVKHLRDKIDEPGKPTFIQAVRGAGYVLRDPQSAES